MRYILDGHNPVVCDDLLMWARWFESHDRRIARTVIGPYTVSTVFIGIDHQWGDGRPLLFETLVFANDDRVCDERMERYSTWDEAVAGHEAICAELE